MSEYIMGLGISVKICKIYEELIYLTFSNSDMTDEYYDNIAKLRDLIEDETETYDKLDSDDILKYFKKVNEEDISEFDAVKSRYYSKLKEREDLIENDSLGEYPFTLNTAIVGKILLESLVNIEKYFLKEVDNEIANINDDNFYDLYSFHKIYKYTLISMNDFVERLAVDFDFYICDIPEIGFDKIKNNFRCNDNFYKYLDDVLLILGKEIVQGIISNNKSDDINIIYSTLLGIFQLQVVISYLNNDSLCELRDYCNELNIYSSINGKYIKKLVMNNKLYGDTYE